jgi:hypothetical protein
MFEAYDNAALESIAGTTLAIFRPGQPGAEQRNKEMNSFWGG